MPQKHQPRRMEYTGQECGRMLLSQCVLLRRHVMAARPPVFFQQVLRRPKIVRNGNCGKKNRKRHRNGEQLVPSSPTRGCTSPYYGDQGNRRDYRPEDIET